jgi:hypothetical protein
VHPDGISFSFPDRTEFSSGLSKLNCGISRMAIVHSLRIPRSPAVFPVREEYEFGGMSTK